MVESEDEICDDFYESLTQESLVETPQKKRDFAEIGEDDVSNKPTSSKKQKAEKSGGKSLAKSKKWTDKEIDKLLEMLEDRVCLWDVSSKEYHLRDKRAKAYKEMEEKLGVSAAEIKSKIVGLRAQLGREMVKVRAMKSGMALSEVYESNWIYWDRLQFLTKVMEARKSKDNLVDQGDKHGNSPGSVETSVTADANSFPVPSQGQNSNKTPNYYSRKSKKNDLEMKRQELLSTCINVLKEPAPSQQAAPIQCPFSLYVAEKRSQFDRMTRMVAEKRISDVLFELEMKENSFQPFGQYHLQPTPADPTDSVGNISSPYINHMLQNTNYR
ncbi:Hypothetical predicted protein [Paramuricea clavata]|uniref:Uncharacterized protein n=1 Tax=Paramuricea clavata TaxID=317549 RepID=A0A7D9DT50_PARCT|nr:Hypothetical predicted protein [Paramuricea clavata]